MALNMKKILISISVALSVIITALVIIVLDAKNLVYWYLRPDRHFDASTVPPAPDYSSEQCWAALPTRKDESDLVPAGAADSQADARADVFYIHPTGYFSAKNWNAAVDPKSEPYNNVRIMLAGQASAFNGCCRVYAPHYREAALYSFLDSGNDGVRAMDIAYSDVAQAFDYYIRHYNRKRPFVIAAHSQGSMHALRLLEEKIDRTPLYSQLIAAYVIGASIPVEKFIRSFSRVRPCSGALDTGCIISWNTYARGSVPRKMGFVWYREGWEDIDDKDTICTNPLSWENDGKMADGHLYHGAIFLNMGELWKFFLSGSSGRSIKSLNTPGPLMLSARCEKGFLFVPKVKEVVDPLGRGSYHIYDYSLFYMNIRRNACDRVSAFLKPR